MRIAHFALISAGVLLLVVPGIAMVRPKKGLSKTHAHANLKHASSKHHGVSRASGHHEMARVEMPTERATEIQTALIKQGYLTGEPTGTWDPQTVSAMQKLQSDNGWQSKVTPDSRALIKLGLGPEVTTAAAGAPSVGARTPPQ